jgi:integrating conjugative element protein (TIGR03765 family)
MMKRCKLQNGLVLMGFVLLPMLACAEITVIYDSGHTQPLAPYLEILDTTAPTTSPALKRSPTLGAADINTLLPIHSPGLTPGPVAARSHHRPFARPFFLIGSDQTSKQWLIKHRDRLKEIGATGMLVQAETLADLQTTAELSGGLPIMPASASDIAAALGITHYPVLITSQGIEQ